MWKCKYAHNNIISKEITFLFMWHVLQNVLSTYLYIIHKHINNHQNATLSTKMSQKVNKMERLSVTNA